MTCNPTLFALHMRPTLLPIILTNKGEPILTILFAQPYLFIAILHINCEIFKRRKINGWFGFYLLMYGFFASILMTRIESWTLLMSMKFFPFFSITNLLKYGAEIFC